VLLDNPAAVANANAVKYEDLPNEVGAKCCLATQWLWLMLMPPKKYPNAARCTVQCMIYSV